MAAISSTASHPAINGCVQALPKFASAVTRNPQRVHIRCVLPLGTANDFARSIGLSVEDLTAALLIVAVTATSPIDLGLFDGRPFVNMLTGGFGCQVTAETDPALKRRLGGHSLTRLPACFALATCRRARACFAARILNGMAPLTPTAGYCPAQQHALRFRQLARRKMRHDRRSLVDSIAETRDSGGFYQTARPSCVSIWTVNRSRR